MTHKTRLQPPIKPESKQPVRVNASTWREVRSAAGRLLFKIDPQRMLIQVRLKGETTTIDLAEWLDVSAPGPVPAQRGVEQR